MKMYKRPITLILFFSSLLLVQGCSWFASKPDELDSNLLEAMQTSKAEPDSQQQAAPIIVHYEIKHKPLRHQELVIALEIKPGVDLIACAYSVKLSEGLDIIEPVGIINLGSLKAGETYIEEIALTPVSEGLHEVKLFVAAEVTAKQPQTKSISIPISVGPFQKTRRAPE